MNSIYEWVLTRYDPYNKDLNVRTRILTMLNRSLQIFRYNGLPDTVTDREVELLLQCEGFGIWLTADDGQLYLLHGSLGGELNHNRMPSEANVNIASADLNINRNGMKVDHDCVVMTNDSMYLGLIPLHSRYATMQVENELTLRMVDIYSRVQAMITAPDDNTKRAADKWLKDLEDGKLTAVASDAFLRDLAVQTYASSSSSSIVTALTEYQQYLEAKWWNELGLMAQFNMKREAINSNESQLNEDSLLPLIDDMLTCRQKALEKVNSMFGTNITVEFNSSWEDNREELEAIMEQLEESEPEGESVEEVKEDEAAE